MGQNRLSGVTLERSAEVLWAQYKEDREALMRSEEPDSPWSVAGPFMLLAGLTVENYLKGLCVKRSTPVFDEKGRFTHASHNLLTLSGSARLTINDSERELLDRLTRFIEFAGRYPAPMRAEGLMPIAGADGGSIAVRRFSSGDYNLWRAFVDKLNNELDAYMAK